MLKTLKDLTCTNMLCRDDDTNTCWFEPDHPDKTMKRLKIAEYNREEVWLVGF